MRHFTRFFGQIGASQTDLTPTTITAGTANTKGSWSEVISETEYDFDVYYVVLPYENTQTAGAYDGFSLDVGFDPAGGTTYGVAVPDILVGSAEADAGASYGFPVHIPNGSAIACRLQSTTGSETVEVGMQLYGGSMDGEPYPPQGLVVAYGVTTSSDTQGTVLADNASANAYGAWTEITSATTHPHRGLVLGVEHADTDIPSSEYVFDVATGAASSEVAVASRFGYLRSNTSETLIAKGGPPFSMLVEQPIPEGVRLAVRAQARSNSAVDNLEVALYGWG